MPEYKISFTVRLSPIPLGVVRARLQLMLRRAGFEENEAQSLRVTGPWFAPASYPRKKGD